MKYDVQFTSQFKKDLKLAKKQHKNIDKLFSVINTLANGETLNAKYKDHDLMGNYKGLVSVILSLIGRLFMRLKMMCLF